MPLNHSVTNYLSRYHLLFGVMTKTGHWNSLSVTWQQLGYDPSQLINELYLNLVHPEDQTATQQSLAQLQFTTTVSFSNRYRHQDGSYHLIIWQFTLMADETSLCATGTLDPANNLFFNGAVPPETAIFLEKSPQAQEIVNLAQKLNELQTILEGLQEAVIVQYADGQLQTLNSRVEQLLGRAIEPTDFEQFWQAGVSKQTATSAPIIVSFQNSAQLELKLSVQVQTIYGAAPTMPPAKVLSLLDVTTQSQQHLALQQLQQNFECFMQLQCEVILDWDLRTNQVDYSTPWRNLLGYTPADLGHQISAWYSRIHPADHSLVVKEVKNYVEGVSAEYERIHRLQHKDGSYRWLHSRGKILREERGQNSRLLVAFFDITESKRLEQTLEATKKYEQLFLTLAETVLVLDGRGRILDANPAAWQLYGYGRQELLQLKANDIFTTDLTLGEVLTPQATYHKKKDGSLLSVEVMMKSLTWQTQKLWIVTIRDATSAKQTLTTMAKNEAHYRLLFEAVAEAIVVFDATTHQVFEVNSAALAGYGYTREQWLHLQMEDILMATAPSVPHLRAAGRQKFYKIPIDWHRKQDGTVFPVEISTSSYKVKNLTLVCALIRDITERQKTEEELRKTLEFVNALIQTSPVFFIIITPAGQISLVNDTFSQALGYQTAELIGQNYLTRLIPESDRLLVADQMNALMSQREIKKLSEITVLTKDKRQLLLECHCRIMLDHQGQVEYLFAVGIDIGERRQVLQELQMFKTIVDNSNEAIAIRGADKSLIYINPAHKKLFKHTFEEARQSFYRDYLPPTSRQKVNQEIRPHLEKAGKTWEGILDMQNTDGQAFPVWARFDAVHDEDGNILFAFSLMHDITKQQQMETALRYEREQYETIFNAAPLMIVYKDQAGRFIRVNRFAAILFNTTPELMQGQDDEQIIPNYAKQYRAIDLAVIESGQPKLGVIEQYPHGYLRADRIPYRDTQGKILGVIVFAMEISEQIKTELALRYEHEQYETIFHSAPLSIIYKDKENRLIRANHYAAYQMGINLKELPGMSMYEIMPEHAKEYHTSDLEVISTGKPKLGLIEKHSGGGFSQVDKIPYCDAEGKIQGVIVFSMNITKRIRIEQALRQQQQVLQESESNLRQALETLPTMVYVIDHKFNFLLWNHECEQVTGYSAAQIINNPQAWAQLYPNSAYREEMLATTREMVENYAGFRDWEWTLTCQDGSQKTILWSGSSEADTEEFSLCAVGQDITEHEQVLQLLCDSEERLRLVIENMPVLFIAYNGPGQLVLWNRHCEKLTGYKTSEILRNPQALEWLYPQVEYRNQMLERFQNAQIFGPWETEMTCKDGSTKLIAWSNISKNFPVPGWAGWMVGEDHSSFKSAQQLFNQPDALLNMTLNGINVAISVTDGRGRYVYVNAQYGQLFGYDGNDLINKIFSVVLPPEQHQLELRHYFRFLTNSNEKSFSASWEIGYQPGSVKIQVLAQRLEIEPVYVVWTIMREE